MRLFFVPSLTLDRSRVHTVSTTPLYTSQPPMPTLPITMLPLDPINLKLDVESLSKMEDDSHLRGLVHAGGCQDHSPDREVILPCSFERSSVFAFMAQVCHICRPACMALSE
jgi:hypothetical protein